MTPILSICIPTYNRAKLLDRLLHNICVELETLKDKEKIEIVVSDNASTDHTTDIVSQWSSSFPIKYNRNDTNLGYDRNLIACIKLATGKYIWSIGDDDLILNGSICKLIKDLEQEEVGAVYLNQIKGSRSISIFDFGLELYKTFTFQEFVKLPTCLNIGFGGATCIHREKALKIITEKIEIQFGRPFKKNCNDFSFHEFMHTYLFLEIAKNSKVGVEPDYGVIVDAGVGAPSWQGRIRHNILFHCLLLDLGYYYGLKDKKFLFTTFKSRIFLQLVKMVLDLKLLSSFEAVRYYSTKSKLECALSSCDDAAKEAIL